jgi:hypothetical protein
MRPQAPNRGGRGAFRRADRVTRPGQDADDGARSLARWAAGTAAPCPTCYGADDDAIGDTGLLASVQGPLTGELTRGAMSKLCTP